MEAPRLLERCQKAASLPTLRTLLVRLKRIPHVNCRFATDLRPLLVCLERSPLVDCRCATDFSTCPAPAFPTFSKFARGIFPTFSKSPAPTKRRGRVSAGAEFRAREPGEDGGRAISITGRVSDGDGASLFPRLAIR